MTSPATVVAFVPARPAVVFVAAGGRQGAPGEAYRRSLRSFPGVVGDGVHDDTAGILSALDSGERLTGQWRTYAVSEDIMPPDTTTTVDLANTSFLALDPQTTSKTMYINGNPKVVLDRVSFNRGTQRAVGSNAEAAGLRIDNCPDLLLLDIDVTGDGACKGIRLANCSGRVVRPTIHDMVWSADADPGTEMIEGLFLSSCASLEVHAHSSKRLGGTIGAGPLVYLQTDGVTLSGCTDISFFGGISENVTEGMDVSGAGNNRNIAVYGTTFNYCVFGLKFVHGAIDCLAVGTRAYRCGLSGLIIAGTNINNPVGPRGITVVGHHSIDTGYGGVYAAQAVSGIQIQQGQGGVRAPQDIRLISPRCFDEQAVPTMHYAIRNEASASNVTVLDLQASGWTVAETVGVDKGMVQILSSDGSFKVTGPMTVTGDFTPAGNVTIATGNLVVNRFRDTPRAALPLVNGLNSNIVVTREWNVVGGPTAPFSIGGFTNPADGRTVQIFNSAPQDMTIVLEDVLSTTANRIDTLTGANVTLTGKSAATFKYSGATSRWILIGMSP